MMYTVQQTLHQPWALFKSTNYTGTSFTALATQTAVSDAIPTDSKAVETFPGSTVASILRFMPYAVGTAAGTVQIRVIGWTLYGTDWVPEILGEVTCTLSAVNLSGSNKTMDAITIDVGEANITVQEVASAAGFGTFDVDTKGCRYVTLDVDRGAETSVNCLYRRM